MNDAGIKTRFFSQKEGMFFLIIFIFVFAYFFPLRTIVAFGDDIQVAKAVEDVPTILGRFFGAYQVPRFRPVEQVVMVAEHYMFGKNLMAFFVFAVFIQSLNAYLLSRILSFFIQWRVLVVALCLVFAGSKFCYYNMTQLYNGAALEGLSMTWFMLFVYNAVRFLYESSIKKHLYYACLFAVLAMFTHERYLVLAGSFAVTVWFIYGMARVGVKDKLIVSLLCLGAIFINFQIKHSVLKSNFMTGTAGFAIDLDPKQIWGFFYDGLCSVFEINTGINVGIDFEHLSFGSLIVMKMLVGIVFVLIVLFGYLLVRNWKKDTSQSKISLAILFFMVSLLVATLCAASITVRLEQRWLQAPFASLIIIVALLFGTAQRYIPRNLNLAYLGIAVLFLIVDSNYLYGGYRNYYMKKTENYTIFFKQLIDEKKVDSTSPELYIVLPHRDGYTEVTLDWGLDGGVFFNYYGLNTKKLVFVGANDTIPAGKNAVSCPHLMD